MINSPHPLAVKDFRVPNPISSPTAYTIVGKFLQAQPKLRYRRFQALKNPFMEASAPVIST
jgi:hypothetical protein